VNDNSETSDRPHGEFGAGAETPGDTLWSLDPQKAPEKPPGKAEVYDRILLDIVLGVLPPDARLDEQGLAESYDAGLAAIRRALERLSLDGLIHREAPGCTRVAPIDAIEVRQILEVRRLLEPHAAALAAEYASPEDIDALGHVFDGAEAAIRIGDYRTLLLMDHAFHVRLARASGNCALASLIAPLQLKAARLWACAMAAGQGPANQIAVDQAEVDSHRAMVKLIAMRDASGARTATLRALGGVRHDVDRLSSLAAPARRQDVQPMARA